MQEDSLKYDTEGKLWQAFLDNVPGSLERIYKTFIDDLYSYGYKFTKNHPFTEDCIQEVFITLHQKRSYLSRTTSVKFYLFKCLRVEIHKRLRNEMKHSGQDVLDDFFDGTFHAEQQLIQDEVTLIRVRQIAQAVNELPKRQKEAIYLRFYEGMSYQKIADLMETEQTSAYKIIYKAIASLYEKLSIHSGKLFSGPLIHFLFFNSFD